MDSAARGPVWLAGPAHAPAALAWGGCLVLAVASLALPSAPTYDPWAWVVFGRELVVPGLGFSTLASTGWKPLAVLFTAPLALFGPAAPSPWLVVVRSAGLAALTLAFRLGGRAGGPIAGAIAALALFGSSDWLRGAAGIEPAPVWIGALCGVAFGWRARDRTVAALAVVAAAWALPTVAGTALGYPAVPRYLVVPAAISCVLAGIGLVAVAGPASRLRGRAALAAADGCSGARSSHERAPVVLETVSIASVVSRSSGLSQPAPLSGQAGRLVDATTAVWMALRAHAGCGPAVPTLDSLLRSGECSA